jgi:hypothetical protein
VTTLKCKEAGYQAAMQILTAIIALRKSFKSN